MREEKNRFDLNDDGVMDELELMGQAWVESHEEEEDTHGHHHTEEERR